ncbi:unnamed protein product [Caenorhabditis angaria]|uniref:Uncharacterized protein n=1 Tax=Caenorhabditis angaria TaxID=860376 RepID=A0A9P1IB91_9PELO|nr:unnamed protein product [Caenorhabditis angaria]
MLLQVLTFIVILSFDVALSGSAGKCRSECVERGEGFIVRAHLKDDSAMVGVCRNTTSGSSSKSIVTPYVCDRNIGAWSFHEDDEEGIVRFDVVCPTAKQYTQEELADCPPTIVANLDEILESSGQLPSQ